MIIEPDVMIQNQVVEKEIDLSDLDSDTVYKNCQITSSYKSPKIREVKFEHCQFLMDDLNAVEILDCFFVNCNFSNMAFQKAVVYRSIFEGCKLLGNDFMAAKFSNVKFVDSQLKYMNLSFSNLKSVLFENSDLTGAFLQEVQLKDVFFNKSSLNDVDFSETNLKGIDLSNSFFENMIITPSLVRGLKISAGQAPFIAAQLGITICY